MSKKDCPFCNYAKRAIIKENALAYLILSNPRKVPGHSLVIPKRHVEEPWKLSSGEILDVFDLVAFAEKKLLKDLVTGCDVRQNFRPFIPQGRLKVDHIHYHVIPRDPRDIIFEISERYEIDLFKDLTDEESARITKIFR